MTGPFERLELVRGPSVDPVEHPPEHLPEEPPRLAERGLDAHVERPEIPHEPGPAVEQSSPTDRSPTGPAGDRGIEFTTYTPAGPSGLVPPDSSGTDSPIGVVLYTGNTYLMASTDGGATFTEHDTTDFLPAARGRPVDQVMIYVPHRRMFAWMMQHKADPDSGEGMFRLAVARVSDVARDVERSWTVYDFTSSDVGSPGTATDRQDLAYSEDRLYMTTNLAGVGRIVLSLSLEDLDQRRTVQWWRTDPLESMFQFSDLSQQNTSNVHTVAIASDSRLRVMTLDDATVTYSSHDVSVGQFPREADLVSLDPDDVDWLTRGVAHVSAAVMSGDHLWVAWDAAKSADGADPRFPHAHVRLARIDPGTWKTVEEHQVWNDDYAFAYGCLAVGRDGDLGYGVGVGGPADFPNACFGILGDHVVYFRDTSTVTAVGDGEARWGDYITVRPSWSDSRRFAAFGYWTTKDGGGGQQHPYYLSYGRP